jgi:hypothetical protein
MMAAPLHRTTRGSRGPLRVACAVGAVLVVRAGSAIATAGETSMRPAEHFRVVSSVTSPTAADVAARLERTWRIFRDLFDVEPAPVTVVLAAGGTAGASQADQARAPATPHTIAWSITEGEDLEGQGLSDLSHEIAHMYFLDVMGNPTGLHQEHAWLHEAVACHHEGERLATARETWIRERLAERVPLAELFTMRNPVKVNPLVELTAELHGKLARGEITVAELNARVGAYAAAHATELAEAGARNMTYYAQSLSVFRFLVETKGAPFVRTMARRLRDGGTMDEFLRREGGYPDGAQALEEAWVGWVRKG